MSKESRSCSSTCSGPIKESELLKALLSDRSHLSKIISSVPTQRLHWSLAEQHAVDIYVRRDDLIHKKLSGNKLYKLWGHLQHWHNFAPSSPILSFGGAYSNHLYALAAFGELANVQTYGVIRGERPKNLSPTLRDLISMGMKLVFVSRFDYRRKEQQGFVKHLLEREGLPALSYVIPEGGAGLRGYEGCIELGRYLATQNQDTIVQACGTGTTLSGLIVGLGEALSSFKFSQNTKRILGVSALKSDTQIIKKVLSHTATRRHCSIPWALTNQYHGGGFAKTSPAFKKFVREFEEETALSLERVYTGKMVFGLARMIERGVVAPGESILLMHSGGLQGNRTL